MNRRFQIPSWIRLAAVLAAALLVMLLFLPIPVDLRHDRVIGILGELMHVVIFVAVAAGLYLVGPVAGRLGPVVLISVVLGGVTELAQRLVGRDAGWDDLFLDLLGAAITAVAVLIYRGRRRAAVLVGLGVIAGLLFSLRSLPPILRATAAARSSFPLLADFENPDQASLWYGLNGGEKRLDRAASGHGGVLRLDIDGEEKYPGVTVVRLPHDWSAWQELLVDVRLRPPAPDSLHVWLRLLDYEAKRDAEWAQRRYTASHTWRTLDFSLLDLDIRHHGRPFDLGDIHALTVSLSSAAGPAALEIDNVRLR